MSSESLNKGEFVTYLANKNGCTKADAERAIDMFTNGVIGALGDGYSITLVGFGSFSVSHVPAKPGRNPRTGDPITISAYNQPKFKVGLKMKAACNK
jgi:DNA-binding protein HU-beta